MKTNWKIDTVHSTLGFGIKLLGISAIRGSFSEYEGTFRLEDGNWETAKISLKAPVKSICTGNNMRDEHLQDEYWFDTKSHPEFSFESTSIKKKSDTELDVKGNLTLKGQTHPVDLRMRIGGKAKDKDGVEKMGLSGSGNINREHYNIAPGAKLPSGEVFLGEKIKVRFEMQLNREEDEKSEQA